MTIENKLYSRYIEIVKSKPHSHRIGSTTIEVALEVLELHNSGQLYNTAKYRPFIFKGIDSNRFDFKEYKNMLRELSQLRKLTDDIYFFVEWLNENTRHSFKAISGKIGVEQFKLKDWDINTETKLSILFIYKRYVKRYDNKFNT